MWSITFRNGKREGGTFDTWKDDQKDREFHHQLKQRAAAVSDRLSGQDKVTVTIVLKKPLFVIEKDLKHRHKPCRGQVPSLAKIPQILRLLYNNIIYKDVLLPSRVPAHYISSR